MWLAGGRRATRPAFLGRREGRSGAVGPVHQCRDRYSVIDAAPELPSAGLPCTVLLVTGCLRSRLYRLPGPPARPGRHRRGECGGSSEGVSVPGPACRVLSRLAPLASRALLPAASPPGRSLDPGDAASPEGLTTRPGQKPGAERARRTSAGTAPCASARMLTVTSRSWAVWAASSLLVKMISADTWCVSPDRALSAALCSIKW